MAVCSCTQTSIRASLLLRVFFVFQLTHYLFQVLTALKSSGGKTVTEFVKTGHAFEHRPCLSNASVTRESRVSSSYSADLDRLLLCDDENPNVQCSHMDLIPDRQIVHGWSVSPKAEHQRFSEKEMLPHQHFQMQNRVTYLKGAKLFSGRAKMQSNKSQSPPGL